MTESELIARASSLAADLGALEQRIAACPGGSCADASAIRADLSSAEQELGRLQAALAELPAGSQQGSQQVEAAAVAIGNLRTVVDTWEQ